MKNYFKAICMIFLIISCGTSKKTTKSTTHEKIVTHIEKSVKDSIVKESKTKVIKNDSIVKETETLATESEMEFDLEDLAKTEGDFKTTVKSGESEITIEKKGGKLKITTKTAGSKSTDINVTKSETTDTNSDVKVKETNDNTLIEKETDTSESTTVKKRMIPWFVWIIAGLVALALSRKKLFTLLANVFPALKATRLFLFILGLKK